MITNTFGTDGDDFIRGAGGGDQYIDARAGRDVIVVGKSSPGDFIVATPGNDHSPDFIYGGQSARQDRLHHDGEGADYAGFVQVHLGGGGADGPAQPAQNGLDARPAIGAGDWGNINWYNEAHQRYSAHGEFIIHGSGPADPNAPAHVNDFDPRVQSIHYPGHKDLVSAVITEHREIGGEDMFRFEKGLLLNSPDNPLDEQYLQLRPSPSAQFWFPETGSHAGDLQEVETFLRHAGTGSQYEPEHVTIVDKYTGHTEDYHGDFFI